MRLSSGVVGKAQEIGNNVFVPFDVMALQAMGAARDKMGQLLSCELDRFAAMWQVQGKLSPLAEPANHGGVVSRGKDAAFFAPIFLALNQR